MESMDISIAWHLGHWDILKKVSYTSEAIAIIEFEDRIACIYPWEVKFVDEENHELHWMNKHEQKRKEKNDESSLD